jgi:acyl transferase domain-containing protein
MNTPSRPPSLAGIAIIGMAARIPGARDLEQFWTNLRTGLEAIQTFSEAQLRDAGVPLASLADPAYVRRGTKLDHVEDFDAAFFGMSPAEASLIDPQQRVFLECAWEVLESAGYDPRTYSGSIGVYGGSNINEYLLNNILPHRGRIQLDDLSTIMGFDKDYLTTRVSYKLGLRGPSVVVQTACSTSLVAVHLAADALLAGQCDMALAGGVSVLVPHQSGYAFREGGIKSLDGHCRSFDAAAQGTVFGSGAGIVLLKRLSDAIEDRDTILAVIRGSAINNDGASKIGYAAPSIDGQSRVIAEALAIAEVDPVSVSYVEAHGTATPLGDPIEIAALSQAFNLPSSRRGTCTVGSVKSNLGHLNTAAGVVGLIKTTLALRHRELPPTIHFQTPNPKLEIDRTPFRISSVLEPWAASGGPRRAGVSSFGVGGTNAHVVVEEAPEQLVAPSVRPYQLIVLSARTPTALDTATDNLAAYLRAHADYALADVAYTLSTGRRAMRHRRFIVCRDVLDAADTLASRDSGRIATHVGDANGRSVVFMFPGQGAQHVGMGRELYGTEPLFRDTVDRCASILRSHLELDLREIVFAPDTRAADAATTLTATSMAQPALFVIEYAAAQLFMSWGVTPAAMVGHSIGEYVAACLAGVFSLEDALRLVAVRGRLMNGIPPGVMLAIPAAEDDVRRLLPGDVSVAAVNGPSLTVVSGAGAAIERLERALSESGLTGRRLHTSHAFHSAMMDPILPLFAAEVARTRLATPRIPYLSNLTGTWTTDRQATDPAYWTQHLRQCVRFSDGIAELLKARDRVLLEVGPGDTLAALARRRPDKGPEHVIVSSMPSARDRQQADCRTTLAALGELWASAVEVNWSRFYEREERRRVPLPTYPFERQRFWIDPPSEESATSVVIRTIQSPRRRRPFDDWFAVPSWVSTSTLPATTDAALRATGPWLIMAEPLAWIEALGRSLRERGVDVISVAPGHSYECGGVDKAFSIRVNQREDYTALFDALRAANRLPGTIVHAFTAESGAASSPDALHRGFFSLLFTAQAFGRQSFAGRLRVVVVTSGVGDIVDTDGITPEHAAILGPVRTIPLEYDGVSAQAIDIGSGDRSEDDILPALIAEIVSGVDVVVAHRGRRRWVQHVRPVRVPAVQGRPHLRTRGVYLITGGLGGLGLTIAQHVARTTSARLVLVGRSALPPKSDWPTWISDHGGSDQTSARIKAIQAIEAAGADVLIATADVTDRAAMKRVIEQVVDRFGTIHGVIHAAGVPGGGLIQLKDEATAAAVLAPKISGARVLEDVLSVVSLDWFLLCSSTHAVRGRMGQVDYSAANAFLDAFARDRANRGLPTVSVNWDGWQEVGMAAAAAAVAARVKTSSDGTSRVSHPLLGGCVGETSGRLIYRKTLRADSHWLLTEHRVAGSATVPGTAFFEIVSMALDGRMPREGLEFSDVVFSGPLSIPNDSSVEMFTVIDDVSDVSEFVVLARTMDNDGQPIWRQHVTGHVGRHAAAASRVDVEAIRRRCTVAVDLEARVAERGSDIVFWGPRWQSLAEVRVGVGEVIVRLELPQIFATDTRAHVLHPALVDVATGVSCEFLGGSRSYVPLSYERVSVFGAVPTRIFSHARVRSGGTPNAQLLSVDVTVMTEAGAVVMEVEGYTLRRLAYVERDVSAGDRARLDARKAQAYEMLLAQAGHDGAFVEGIAPGDGIEAFDRILAAPPDVQVIVSPIGDEKDASTGAAALDERIVPSGPRPEATLARAASADTADGPQTLMERELAGIWRDALGLSSVGIHDNFFELGGDSVVAVQIVARAKKHGVKLAPNDIFEHQTIAELASAAVPPAAPLADAPVDPSRVDTAPATPQVAESDFNWSEDDLSEIVEALGRLSGKEEHDDSGQS